MLLFLRSPIDQLLVLRDLSLFTNDFKFRFIELLLGTIVINLFIAFIIKLLPDHYKFPFIVMLTNLLFSTFSIVFYHVYNHTYSYFSYNSWFWRMLSNIKNNRLDIDFLFTKGNYSEIINFYLEYFVIFLLPILIFIVFIVIGFNSLSSNTSNKQLLWKGFFFLAFIFYTVFWLKTGNWLAVFELTKMMNTDELNFALTFYTRLQRSTHCMLFLIPLLFALQDLNVYFKGKIIHRLRPYTSKFINNWVSIAAWQRLCTIVASTLFYIFIMSFYKEQHFILDILGCLSFLPVVFLLRSILNLLFINSPLLAMVRVIQTGLDESVNKLVRTSKTHCEPLKNPSISQSTPQSFSRTSTIGKVPSKPTVGSVISSKIGIAGPVVPSTLNLSEVSKSSPLKFSTPLNTPLVTSLEKFDAQLELSKKLYLSSNPANPTVKDFYEWFKVTYGDDPKYSEKLTLYGIAIGVAVSFGLFAVDHVTTREERIKMFKAVIDHVNSSKKWESISLKIEKGELL